MSVHTRDAGSIESQADAGELKMPMEAEQNKENVPAGYVEKTAEEKARNRALNLKMDIFLLPVLALLYLFNGLDRGNVGNAQTQGFTKDIGASPDDLNLATSLFFITFILFQPPSAAMGRWIGARYWIPFIMFCWGIITICQAYIKGRGSLIGTRLLIGAFEAGFYPCAVAYLSFFYTRYDLAVRVGLFYGQYAIAGAFSGAIAYGVFQIKDPRLYPWQYLFIIEGSITAFFALVALVWLPVGPGSAWFLNEADREYAVRRIRVDNELYTKHNYQQSGIEQDRLTKRDVVETAKDWKLWYVLFFNICASVPSQAFSVFLPLVVEGLGFTSLRANLMSVPPYVCGAVGLYIFAFSSDKFNERGYHILAGLLICLTGLIVTVTVDHNGSKYAGLCILTFGSYISAPLTIAWLSGNTPEPGMRALVLGVNGFGNFAGVIGSQLYKSKYSPGYRLPFYATLGFVAAAILGYCSYRFTLQAVNKRRHRKLESMSPQEIEDERINETRYSDKKLTFTYGL